MSLIDQQIKTLPKCACCNKVDARYFWGESVVCGPCIILMDFKQREKDRVERLSVLEEVRKDG